MKLQFDANQQYQLDAVDAVVDLFAGQPRGVSEFVNIELGEWSGMYQAQGELGVGNQLIVSDERLHANTRTVQTLYDIEVADPSVPLDAWPMFDHAANTARNCPHFSIEMETGTGKTYVYLRTIFELSRRYGFTKFIIVVPSVAIREGTLKNIEITGDHFRALFNNIPFEHFVYDAKKVNRLRQFAVSNTLQILIINIDAFRKNFEDVTDPDDSTETQKPKEEKIEVGKKSAVNVIYKESDKLSGRAPIEFVRATRPIVIIDEPQSVDSTPKAQVAIKSLNPLLTLRYSATHREVYNRVYRLDPVRAFELKLVKQIIVASAIAEGGVSDAFVRVENVEYKKGISAKLRILVQGSGGPKEKVVTVKDGSDLHTLSGELARYQSGYKVAEIYAEEGQEFIRFDSGRVLRKGEEIGGMRTDVWRVQIKHTVKKHLDKELQLRGRGIKVLSLFFIDRVANYRDYDDSDRPVKGKFAQALEESLAEFAKDARYKELAWLKLPIEQVHNGYFAQDKKGAFKDTRGDTQADDEIYNLIMKEKERLLSEDEPLRFIFSHSALREGWDNPNVFQICTLNETKSAVKKRQEIGRGLRLPVDKDGKRVFDDSINKLVVMANESYEDFARTLQKEYEEDCGVTFGKVPLSALAKLTRVVDGRPLAIGKNAGEIIRNALIEQKMVDAVGYLLPAFDPGRLDFKVDLPEALRELTPAVVDLLASYKIERHIRKEKDERVNHLRKDVQLSPEFQELWKRIKPKTTYRVEFATDELVGRAVAAVKRMEKIETPIVRVQAGRVKVKRGGVEAEGFSSTAEEISMHGRAVPDLLAYLQNETELTRSTLVRILKESGRLAEFFADPQRFLDRVAGILKNEMQQLLVDGIKYERIPGVGSEAEWEMSLFENEEMINYFNALRVNRSVYEYIVYESEVEREFAKKLDERDDIKLFVKLPRGFEVDTPLGKYIPDWAIVKHEDKRLYLVRETKGTKDFIKLRTTEANKVRCGQEHFKTLGVPFAVVVSADEV